MLEYFHHMARGLAGLVLRTRDQASVLGMGHAHGAWGHGGV